MAKRLILESDLLQKINKLLAEHDETSKCRVSKVYRLRELDENGCNWSVEYVRTYGTPTEVWRPLAGKLIYDFQKVYNIKD